jgi:RNA polymerase sigma factor (sigma-70 family)
VLSDAELLRAAQNGDTVSLGLLLERYRGSLYAQALRILGYSAQAEDAVHDTFLVALRKIDQVREPNAVGGWLHAVLRNVCLMRLRAQQGEVLFDELYRHTAGELSEPSAEETIERLAMREWVWTALGKLPEILRVTAMLRYFGSYNSYEEIAAILGVPVGTVRSRLSQVKRKLAEALLQTAGLAHGEATKRTESSARFFAEFYGLHNQGEVSTDGLDAFSEDVAVVLPDGAIVRGRELLAEGLMEDQEAGVKLRLTDVMASRDVTVVEGRFENPPDDPFHCPPATAQVHFYRGDRVHRVRFYYASRPGMEEARSRDA